VPTVSVPLVSVAPVTPRSRLLTLDLRQQPFDFRPGQAVLIGTREMPRRPYSIASSPEQAADTRTLELLIALEADGTLGPHLPDLVPGCSIDLEGPLGTFLFPLEPPEQPLLFVAGGTGIAPLRAMIDHVLRGDPPTPGLRRASPTTASPRPRVSLLYSARNGDEFAFIEELRGHESRGCLELHQTVTRDDSTAWAGSRGRIGRSHFESVVHDAAQTLCFVCGPRAMVNESVATLAALGVPAEAIRTEAWVVPRV
jgi:NAD(P)H-flavin reductase